MALSLSESLREARNVQCFCGTDDYTLTSFLRDVDMVLSWSDPAHHRTLQQLMMNKLRGKALNILSCMYEPTFETIIMKLKEEFGVQKTYVSLRNEAMDIKPKNIKDLHHKLEQILFQMNTKFELDGKIELMYRPACNEKLIFDVYVTFLPCHIKSLLIQNGICSLTKAYGFYCTNNILNDIVLVNAHRNTVDIKPYNSREHTKNFDIKGNVQKQNSGHFNGNPNFRPQKSYNNNGGLARQNNNFNDNAGFSGNFQRNSGHFSNRQQNGNLYNPFRQNDVRPQGQQQNNSQNAIEPMEVGNMETFENFRLSPEPPTYQ